MSDSSRVKLKLGDHEFEAEGAPEVVQQQLQAFQEMLRSIPTISVAPQSAATSHSAGNAANNVEQQSASPATQPHVKLEGILHADGRVISLTALPNSIEDAALLIMLGQKEMRNNVSVTGQELGDGLAQSGKIVGRVDRLMEKHIREANILRTGMGRATRYRMTNQGLSKALGVARELLATLPN